MNYILHLNAVMRRFSADERLNPTHVSLYMALFQFWNHSHFTEVIYINRQEVMKMSKIGSKSTYHRCLVDLHKWNYIVYLPTHNPFKNSQVRLPIFGTTCETSTETTNGMGSGRVVERAPVSKIKQLKQIENDLKRPRTRQKVIDFFMEKGWAVREAEKFYSHYEAVGWKLGGRVKIKNWRALAEKWVLRADESEMQINQEKIRSGGEHLKTVNEKNYGKPL